MYLHSDVVDVMANKLHAGLFKLGDECRVDLIAVAVSLLDVILTSREQQQ